MADPRPHSKPIGVSLPPDLIQKIRIIAHTEDRSFSNTLVQLVRRALPQVEAEETITSR